MLLALLVLALVAATLLAPIVAPAVARRRERRALERGEPLDQTDLALYDPGRERRAELRARELLRSCVNDEEWGMYRDLGFIRVPGRHARRDTDKDGRSSYAYLIYAHKPIVAYLPSTGRLLSEYCVEFPDLTGDGGPSKLPASDDVLAKWMALTSNEERVIKRANMHLVGRQLDPVRVRRDLWRLAEWERRRQHRGELSSGAQ
ncbi:MAG: hypothetical protein JW895_09360 [Thermoleophilaceae bacterium]|nr:hypothetical protein [Thermoleophilaceae bacterium]